MDYTINNEDLPLVITFQGFYSGMIPPLSDNRKIYHFICIICQKIIKM